MNRVAFLCVPVYDEAAVDAVHRLLALCLPPMVVLFDQAIADQRNLVEDLLRRWCDEEEMDLIITIGGTLPAPGPSPREIVPDATLAVSERQLPALPAAMRTHAQRETPLALLDRGLAVIRGRTLILNLPAGAGAACLFLDAVGEALEPILARLQETPWTPSLAEAAEDVMPSAAKPGAKEGLRPDAGEARVGKDLDPDEFAQFLKRGGGHHR